MQAPVFWLVLRNGRTHANNKCMLIDNDGPLWEIMLGNQLYTELGFGAALPLLIGCWSLPTCCIPSDFQNHDQIL